MENLRNAQHRPPDWPHRQNAWFTNLLAQMITEKATFGHMVKNFATSSPGAQAAWTAAAHVEAPPKKKEKPPTPPTP